MWWNRFTELRNSQHLWIRTGRECHLTYYYHRIFFFHTLLLFLSFCRFYSCPMNPLLWLEILISNLLLLRELPERRIPETWSDSFLCLYLLLVLGRRGSSVRSDPGSWGVYVPQTKWDNLSPLRPVKSKSQHPLEMKGVLWNPTRSSFHPNVLFIPWGIRHLVHNVGRG